MVVRVHRRKCKGKAARSTVETSKQLTRVGVQGGELRGAACSTTRCRMCASWPLGPTPCQTPTPAPHSPHPPRFPHPPHLLPLRAVLRHQPLKLLV